MSGFDDLMSYYEYFANLADRAKRIVIAFDKNAGGVLGAITVSLLIVYMLQARRCVIIWPLVF